MKIARLYKSRIIKVVYLIQYRYHNIIFIVHSGKSRVVTDRRRYFLHRNR